LRRAWVLRSRREAGPTSEERARVMESGQLSAAVAAIEEKGVFAWQADRALEIGMPGKLKTWLMTKWSARSLSVSAASAVA
jgi:hypothetical protein